VKPGAAPRPDDTPPPVPHARVLVLDRDPILTGALSDLLAGAGHEPLSARHPDQALALLAEADDAGRPVDVVVCEVAGAHGADTLREIIRRHRGAAVIALAMHGSVESAVEALRVGACDYLVKPLVDAELTQSLERALRQRALLAENQSLRRRLGDRYGLDNLVGSDPRMLRVFELVRAVAPSRTTVLMTGESGTGKSLIAHAIHQASPRRNRPFVELSCGSIPETLLESELFGHAKGAFTGAYADKVGRFQAAHTGTIFLDEINSASPAMQLKLLRVLQERRFEPVGATQTIEVDVRVVLASNQPLEQLVADGTFRQDLYYRINVVKIEIAPLRERPGDIPLLAARMLEQQSAELGRTLVGFTPEAMDALRRYRFPGNVRELQNVIERAAVLARGQTIGVEDLPPGLADDQPSRLSLAADAEGPWVPTTLEEALREPERRIIVRALDANGWNRQRTSDQLGINRTTLYKKMKQYGLLGDDRLAG
jgi:DNA-binding NtrC family response regulator